MRLGSRPLGAFFRCFLALAPLACASRDAGEARTVPFEKRREEIVRSAADIARTYAAGDGKPACHADSATHRGSALLLAVSADQCLSCRSVGRMARALAARELGDERAVVVTPLPDTADVCRFLQLERVQLPVIGLPGQLFPDSVLTSDLVVIGAQADGSVSRLLHARDALDLLARHR